ncbi:GumC family protein [Novosphingobium piscinae]|uniref:Lipopolysaccharide biosynthesis protein n=1 Tax=Novosphingobium piscinae TaxID=1507448 RepID=A0A7X1KP93_9SPHN|nr:lipopolysaccharide biosynthesis protein [Novosphingobium piscinae]
MNGPLVFDDNQTDGGGEFLAHVPAILWQRRWLIIIPTVLGIIGAVLAALLIPPTYRASALMLVQSPQLGAMLGADSGEVIDRRIARISERVTSRPDLIALIEKHGLYQDLRKRKPLSEVIETMRDAISLSPTGSDQGASSPQNRTIAFKLSFDYGEAAPAQAVTQDLMQRIVELDATGNSEAATRRVEFLTEQAKGLQTQINEVQGKIAAINAQNGAVLANGGMMMVGSGAGSYDVQIAALQRDTAQLISQRDVARTSDVRDPVVAAAEQALAAARAVYNESHPDVVIAKQRLAEARELAKGNTRKLPLDQIDQQIAFNNSQIAALRAAKAQELSQMSSARSAQARAPLIQTQIADLQSVLAGLNDQYKDVSSKLLAARAGQRAEDEQMGEKLSVVDPPVVPDTPVWPDRLLISVGGIAGGLAVGLVLAFALEFLLRPIRDPGSLAALVGSPPLAMIPVITEVRPGIKNQPRKGGLLARLWPRKR